MLLWLLRLLCVFCVIEVLEDEDREGVRDHSLCDQVRDKDLRWVLAEGGQGGGESKEMWGGYV